MGAAAKPRCAVVFLMILTLGVSLGLPAEDVLDAVYDESEPLPYEISTSVAITANPLNGVRAQVGPDSLQQKPGALSRFSCARGTNRHRSTENRSGTVLLSVLLCILLC
jgi:hypothetical protein